MSGLYHYQGMGLHYLSEECDYAVYYKHPDSKMSKQDYYNPYRVYKLQMVWSAERGWRRSHKLVGKYADLYSAVQSVRIGKGYSI